MPRVLPALLLLATLVIPAWAEEQPPSDASLHELLELNQTQKLLDSVWTQVDAMSRRSVEQQLGGQAVTPAQQAILDDMRSRMIAEYKQDMRWEVMEPMLLDIYRKSFSQHEVDGMLAFYRSDAGRAVVAKMPLVMQNATQVLSAQMSAVLPKLQKIQQDAEAQLRAAQAKK